MPIIIDFQVTLLSTLFKLYHKLLEITYKVFTFPQKCLFLTSVNVNNFFQYYRSTEYLCYRKLEVFSSSIFPKNSLSNHF